MTLDQALVKFLTQLAADGRSPHTVGQYNRHARLFARWCASVGHSGAIGDVSHEDIARFLAAPVARLSARGGEKRAGSMNCLRASLKGFFGYLHAAGHIAEDPTRLMRLALCGKAPPRGLSDTEQRRLLDVLARAEGWEAERDHVLFHTMLSTGIRLGSALGLDVEDVDLDRAEIELRSAKGNRPDRVFLGDGILEHLAKYLDGRESGPLFTTRGGRRLSHRHVQRRFAQWLEKARIKRPASPHSLRHSFALRLYRRTGDVLLVKEALRHRSITSTMVYARVGEERLRRAMA